MFLNTRVQAAPTETATLTLSNQRLFAAALVLSVVPIWFGTYPPLVDIPQHAGQIAAMHQLSAGNETFTALFETNWFTPYLLGYLIPYALTWLLPVHIALKLVLSVAVLAFPVMTGFLLQAVGGDRRWQWLAIPASYSTAFYWGFLSYMVAVPIAIGFLIAMVQFNRDPTLRRGLCTAAFAVFLFFCHVIALGFASLLSAAYLAATHYRAPKELIVRGWPLATPVPLVLTWLALTYSAESAVQNAPIVYGSLLRRIMDMLVDPSGFETLSTFGAIVTAAIVCTPILGGGRLTKSPARWATFSVGLATFYAAPVFAFNTGFLYERLGIFLVPLWLMLWDSGPARSRFDWLPMSIIVLWLLTNAPRFAAFAKESQQFDEILTAMRPGERAAALIVDKTSPLFATPVYLHFASWYQSAKGGIVDFNFADFHPQVVRYRDNAPPRINERISWYPGQFRWDTHGGNRYEYFIVKANADVSPYLFHEHDVELIAQSGWWWLYENRE